MKFSIDQEVNIKGDVEREKFESSLEESGKDYIFLLDGTDYSTTPPTNCFKYFILGH